MAIVSRGSVTSHAPAVVRFGSAVRANSAVAEVFTAVRTAAFDGSVSANVAVGCSFHATTVHFRHCRHL